MIYSSRLIQGLADAGAQISVLCHSGSGISEAENDNPNVTWVTPPASHKPVWLSLLSRLPSIAVRSRSAAMERELTRLLTSQEWDAVVLDNLAMGWALDPVLCAHKGARRPRLVYLSHNHEESVRFEIASAYRGMPLKKLLLLVDAWKAAQLERAIVDAADLVTANTGADVELYRARHPDKPYLVLTPGYDGSVVKAREIGAAQPRRAVIAGSFAWIAKQLNLLAFLETAIPVLDANGVELQIVGAMPEGFKRRLETVFPTVDVVGTVDDFGPYLRRARLAIVPESLGGGFKHKLLQFAFNRVPMIATAGAAEGTTLAPVGGIVECADLGQLAQAAVELIDDLTRLNALQDAAFAACSGRFDWAERGRALAAALAYSRALERRQAA